jgi:hypothetical protein
VKKTEVFITGGRSLARIKTVDTRSLFEWHPTYNKVGTFKLHCDIKYYEYLRDYEKLDIFIEHTADPDHFGIVENVEIDENEDGERFLEVSGRMGEALLERRVLFGDVKYESVQPAQIIAELINCSLIKPAESARQVHNLQIGTLVNADGGVDCFAGKDACLLGSVLNIAQTAYIGFNLRIAENITEELDEETGLMIKAWNPPSLIFETYKGANRTEEDNTETNIETVAVTNLLTNGHFAGLTGWQTWGRVGPGMRYPVFRDPAPIPPPGLSVSGGVVTKTRNYDMIQHMSPSGGEGAWIMTWNESPHLFQSVNLAEGHMYYMAIEVENRTGDTISFGINKLLQTGATAGWTRLAALYVPEKSGAYIFFAGVSGLKEMKNQTVRFRAAVLIDMTATFGVGQEPGFEFMRNNVFFESGSWWFRQQVIKFIPNALDTLVFSRDKDVLIGTHYRKSIVNERNFAYVRGEDVATEIDGGATGWQRKEMAVDASGDVPRSYNGVPLGIPSYTAMLLSSAGAVMGKMTVHEIFEGDLYLLSDKQFGRDYYLGDRVNAIDKEIGFSSSMRISEAFEVWHDNGYSISVVLGDDIFTVTDLIKLVGKGAK